MLNSGCNLIAFVKNIEQNLFNKQIKKGERKQNKKNLVKNKHDSRKSINVHFCEPVHSQMNNGISSH